MASTAGNTYTLGTLSIANQTLTVAGGSNVNSGTAGLTFGATTLTNNATFNVVNPSGGGSTTLTLGAVGGVGFGLTKSGTGTLSLGSTNTYTGATTVNAGTLLVSGSISGSATTVKNGGTLGGAGTTGAVTVASGGTLSPGSSPGVLNTGAVDLQSGATLKLELGGITPGNAATNHDQVSVTGTVTLAGNASVSLFGAYAGTAQAGDQFVVILNDGTGDAVSGAFANAPGNVLNGTDGSSYSVNYAGGDGNDVVLTLTAVPEPGTWAMLLGGTGILVLWQRGRHRARA